MNLISFLRRDQQLEEYLLTAYRWDFPDEDDLKSIPFKNSEEYKNGIAARAMENFAIGLFKKTCSEIGVIYDDVEFIFLQQNEQFFRETKTLKTKGKKTKGIFLTGMCLNLIIPKQTKVERVIKEIERLSPEEQAEAMQMLAGKKIKVTVEDI